MSYSRVGEGSAFVTLAESDTSGSLIFGFSKNGLELGPDAVCSPEPSEDKFTSFDVRMRQFPPSLELIFSSVIFPSCQEKAALNPPGVRKPVICLSCHSSG